MHSNSYWLSSAWYYEAGLSKKSKSRFDILDSGLSWNISGVQAGLGGIWEVSVGTRVSLLTGLVELDGSFTKRQERKQFPLSLFSWLWFQLEMGFLGLAQCEGLGGAHARQAGVLFPEACFLTKEIGRRLVKTTLDVVITWPKFSRVLIWTMAVHLLPWAAWPAHWGLSDSAVCGVSQGVI